MENKSGEDKGKWRQKYHELFKIKFWIYEIFFIVLLLAFWNVIQSTLLHNLGIPDNEIANIISFIVLLGILTTINEYIHCRKACEIEMYDNIAEICFYLEQNHKQNEKILSALQNENTDRKPPNNDAKKPEGYTYIDYSPSKPSNSKQTLEKLKKLSEEDKPILVDNESSENSSNEEEEETPDWYKELEAVTADPFDDSEYETTIRHPIQFDPIAYLERANANTDIIEDFSAKRLIKRYYRECAECITEYTDYSIPHTESRQEDVKINDYIVNISIEISTTDGILYKVKFEFTIS